MHTPSSFHLLIIGKREGFPLGKQLESGFERDTVKKIKERFPGSIVTKLNTKQGIPDRLILFGGKWATLEFKREKNSPHRPNQDWYVDRMNDMSFSRFIYPENCDEVMRDLTTFFEDIERTEDR